jgi:hypothetical protein
MRKTLAAAALLLALQAGCAGEPVGGARPVPSVLTSWSVGCFVLSRIFGSPCVMPSAASDSSPTAPPPQQLSAPRTWTAAAGKAP